MPRGNSRNTDSKGNTRSTSANNRRSSKTTTDALFAGWVNVTIPEATRPEFEAWAQTAAPQDALTALLRALHRVTLNYDPDAEVFVANSFCRDTYSSNAGIMVSQRSEDAFRALAKLLYVHDVLLPEDYSILLESQQSLW